MKIIVQKFGGTSVRNEENRMHALKHVSDSIQQGYKVIVVVSAMGRLTEPYATDTLLNLVNKNKLPRRETDLLISCGEIISTVVFTNMLLENNISAISLTGSQAGFYTNNNFANAKILQMRTERLLNELEKHDCVVVAGFQGANGKGDITTLGRGGSDTSAAAMGAAVNAEYVDIFTDVDGILTADPNVYANAFKLNTLSYFDVCQMAYQGAKVIHPRAVEIAKQAQIKLRIRSTKQMDEGTIVCGKAQDFTISSYITGIAHMNNLAHVRIIPKKNEYHLSKKVFKLMAQLDVSVDFIHVFPTGIAYTIHEDQVNLVNSKMVELGLEPIIQKNCSIISVVGQKINQIPGITAKMLSTLTDNSISILQSSESESFIRFLVNSNQLKTAIKVLHEEYLSKRVEEE